MAFQHPRNGAKYAPNQKLQSSVVNRIMDIVTASLDKTAAGDHISGTISFISGASLVMQNGSYIGCQSGSYVKFDTGAFLSSSNTTPVDIRGNFNFRGVASGSGVGAWNSIGLRTNGLVVSSSFENGSQASLQFNETSGLKSKVTFSPARTISRVIGALPIMKVDSTGSVGWSYNGTYFETLTTSTARNSLAWSLDLPVSATINSVSVWFQPESGHSGFPDGQPNLSIMKIDGTGNISALNFTQEPTGSLATYESPHHLTLSSSQVIDSSNAHYQVVFTGESSTNALSGLRVYSAIVNYTLETTDPAYWT